MVSIVFLKVERNTKTLHYRIDKRYDQKGQALLISVLVKHYWYGAGEIVVPQMHRFVY